MSRGQQKPSCTCPGYKIHVYKLSKCFNENFYNVIIQLLPTGLDFSQQKV